MIDKDLSKRVELEKFQKLVKSLHMSIVSQVAVVLLMGGYLVDKMSTGVFILWSCVFTTLCIGCLIIGLVYRYDEKRGRAEERFEQYMLISMVCSFALGCFWTATAFSRFNEPLAQQVIMLLILVGQSAGSVMALAPNMKLFYSGVPISLLPLGFGFLWLGDQAHSILGALLILFFIFVSFLAHMVNRLVTESIWLRFTNDDLLEEKSSFLASASHDLRQPLHALTLYISALEQKNTSPASRDIMDKVQSTLGSLQRLFDGLLDLSKFDAGVCQPQMKDMLWSDVRGKLQEEFATLATQKNIMIQWSEAECCLYSDALLLEQVIRNLVGNAIRYTDKGSISIHCVRVDTGHHEKRSGMRIDVIDTGIGIKEQYQDTIFDAYTRVPGAHENTHEVSMSTGLGLSIAQRLTSVLGHELLLTSEEGVGSCFSVILGEGELGNVLLAKQETSRLESRLQQECTNILVVDRDACVRDATYQLLASWGCEVFAAATVPEVLHHIATSSFEPDGIITDIALLSAIPLIMTQCDRPNIPAVVLSGAADFGSLRASIDKYQVMRKPLKPASLRAFVIDVREKSNRNKNIEKVVSPTMQNA
ncbi:hypothetical protein A9Q99_07015 [Gammaproteobacteria bacterium 45_16_T64]|nr:hypothetical protein A9Q99_07015 [Gammaproteobacteria bacterium 45_16_T64]